jgi:hypothetical protein
MAGGIEEGVKGGREGWKRNGWRRVGLGTEGGMLGGRDEGMDGEMMDGGGR